MSKPDRSVEEGQDGSGHAEDGRDELKKLFDAIGKQLSDADRRHTATVDELQNRVTDLGREAETLRDHVPEPFSETFGRIERGVAELAKRLGDQNGNPELDNYAPITDGAADNIQSNPFPAPASAFPPKLDERASARDPFVDTFGVVGSDFPDDDGGWDRKSAEDLDGFYRAPRPESSPRLYQSPETAERPFAAGGSTGGNAVWLEERFSEIAKGIEHALAEIKPDFGFDRLGERFDHLEQHITHALEGVATRADLGAVRLIEAHVGEVVNHLAETQHHLTRLNAIEEQLGVISQTLGLTPGAAANPEAHHTWAASAASVDVESIARTAAEQAAQRVADTMMSKDTAELRPLFDQMLSESRVGQENTAMHLDTLQEAMIRVLDRIESMELGSSEVSPFPDMPSRNSFAHHDHFDETTSSPLVTDLDSASDVGDTVHFAMNEPVSRAPAEHSDFGNDTARTMDRDEQRRQDFIAHARRAKLRLAATDDEIVITAPSDSGAFAASSSQRIHGADAAGTRPVRRNAPAAKSSGPSAPSPLLIVVAIATVVLLGGLWLLFGDPSAKQSASIGATESLSDTNAPSSPSNAVGSGFDENGMQKTLAPGQRSDAAPLPTGSIPPKTTTTLPMFGIAVDLDNPVTKASLQKAERHRAMAALSGRLGNAAATGNDAVGVPASMVPNESEIEGSNKPGAIPLASARNGAMEIPDATVGPLSLRLAAANGDPSAQFEVGSRLAEGKGTTQNFKDAAKWYQRSAESGFAPAQYRLGTLYERGLGLKADRALAGRWYRSAADLGNVKAMHNLAVLSANQTEGSPDYIGAAEWFEKAAKRGLADSQFNLAVLYENGLGVKRDLKQAYMWLSLAARNKDKDKDAAKRRDIIRGKMTGDEIVAAEAMTSEWRLTAVDRSVNDARAAGEAWKKNPRNGVSG